MAACKSWGLLLIAIACSLENNKHVGPYANVAAAEEHSIVGQIRRIPVKVSIRLVLISRTLLSKSGELQSYMSEQYWADIFSGKSS